MPSSSCLCKIHNEMFNVSDIISTKMCSAAKKVCEYELIQNRASKSIFPGKSYNDIRNDTGFRTLKERRDVLCMKYFAEIQGSAHKLNGLLPALRKVDYDLRPGFNRYPLARYRTDIYGNSLIPWGLSHWQ